MKLKKNIWIFGFSLLSLLAVIFSSCQGFSDYLKEQFPELDTTSYVYIDGTLMAPVANSTITIGDLLSVDSGVLILDNNNLFHIKMSMDSLMSLKAADIGFSTTVPAGLPIGPTNFAFVSDPISISMPTNLPGKIEFQNPTILLKFSNLMPIEFTFSIKSFNLITNSGTDTLYAITNVNITASDGVTPVYTEEVLDSNDLDLRRMFANMPDSFSISTFIDIPSQTLQNDLNPSQSLSIGAEIDLPFIINATDLVIGDTVDFNLDIPEQIKSVLIKALAENDIPLGGKVYMAVVDSAYTDTIALITNPDFENSQDTLNIMVGTKMVTLKPVIDLLPAETDFAGNPIKVVNSLSKIYLNQSSINQLSNYNGNKKLFIFTKFNTYNSDRGQFVKILSTSYLNIKLGAKIEYEISSN